MNNKFPTGLRDTALILALFIVFSIIGGIPYVIAKEYKLIEPFAAIVMVVAMGGPYILMYYFITWKTKYDGNSSFKFLFKKQSPSVYIWLVVLILLCVLWNYFTAIAIQFDEQWMKDLNKFAEDAILEMYSVSPLGLFINITFVAAIGEEMLFRGVIAKAIDSKYGLKKGVFWSAFLFGIVHGNPSQFIAAFGIGLVLGYLYLTTKNLYLCILIHFINNLIFGSAIFIENEWVSQVLEDENFIPAKWAMIGLFFSIVGILFIVLKIKDMQPHTLIFATQNPNKVKEIVPYLKEEIILKTAKDVQITEEIPETGDTFHQNALQKAQYVYNLTQQTTFSEDSGLEIDGLNGLPGVISARFAGEEKDSDANMDKVLVLMQNDTDRSARFRTVICYYDGQNAKYFEGVCEGDITREKTGEDGFGYDPIFVPKGYSKTFAQLTQEEKNSISHRGKAMKKFISYLNGEVEKNEA